MAIVSKRLYESLSEGSFVDFQFESLTNLGTGIRVLSGSGLPLRLKVTYLGVDTTRTFAPGRDVTWTFLTAPVVVGGRAPASLSLVCVQHARGLIADSQVAVVL
jgi:hypothetical protein